MKTRFKIVMICIASAIVLVVSIPLIVFVSISSGKIKNFKNPNGSILKNSIAEKTVINVNGADNGLIIRGKSLDNPILLFVSSGPGTSDYFLNEAYPDMNLEDYYTVCYWDYRGMCMVYDSKIDPSSITTEQIQQDAKTVTEYLKSRFNKDKIFLMGFSGGTHIALEAAQRHPEDYYAYFAMAQAVCSGSENDTLMYNFMKEAFTLKRQCANLTKLQKSVVFNEDGSVTCKDWASYVKLLHEAGGGTIKDKSEFSGIIVPIIKAHCYTATEKVNYIKGMKMYRETPFYKDVTSRDYRTMITRLELPVYFISGNKDYNCPWPLVQDYSRMIQAPEKKFVLIQNAAHSPLWENPQDTIKFLVEVRDLAKDCR